MPTVAIVDGIKIQFYYDEHPPDHFHVKFAEHRAMIEIETLKILRGHLPRSQYRKVKAWADPRKKALSAAWRACREDNNPGRIA